jgi:predicted transcriptional regulator
LDLDTVEQAAEIVSAYVSHNALSQTDLPLLIQSVHAALAGLVIAAAPAATLAAPAAPVVSIKKSVSPEAITCLDCGQKFKSLKRHIRVSHEMTPDQYRLKWTLPASYPMVAPSYSAQRSSLAKSIGLGRKA